MRLTDIFMIYSRIFFLYKILRIFILFNGTGEITCIEFPYVCVVSSAWKFLEVVVIRVFPKGCG